MLSHISPKLWWSSIVKRLGQISTNNEEKVVQDGTASKTFNSGSSVTRHDKKDNKKKQMKRTFRIRIKIRDQLSVSFSDDHDRIKHLSGFVTDD